MKNLTCVTDIVLPKESGSRVVSNFETFIDKTAVICYIFVKCEFVEQWGLMYCRWTSVLEKFCFSSFLLCMNTFSSFFFFFSSGLLEWNWCSNTVTLGKMITALYNTPQCQTIMQHNINIVFLQLILLLSLHPSPPGQSVHSVLRTPAACWKRPSEVML